MTMGGWPRVEMP